MCSFQPGGGSGSPYRTIVNVCHSLFKRDTYYRFWRKRNSWGISFFQGFLFALPIQLWCFIVVISFIICLFWIPFVPIQVKPTLSPALETAVNYQLKVLSVAISYGGPALLRYKDQFKEVITSAFESPSWKVFFSPCLLITCCCLHIDNSL